MSTTGVGGSEECTHTQQNLISYCKQRQLLVNKNTNRMLHNKATMGIFLISKRKLVQMGDIHDFNLIGHIPLHKDVFFPL